jgi:hypothetical protein
MAKTAWINRNKRKRATVKKYAALARRVEGEKGLCRPYSIAA